MSAIRADILASIGQTPTAEPAVPSPAPDALELLTLAQAGKVVGVTSRTVFHWVHHEGLPVFKLGRVVRIRRSDLAAWIGGRIARGNV